VEQEIVLQHHLLKEIQVEMHRVVLASGGRWRWWLQQSEEMLDHSTRYRWSWWYRFIQILFTGSCSKLCRWRRRWSRTNWQEQVELVELEEVEQVLQDQDLT
jgi:hypothetical protein